MRVVAINISCAGDFFGKGFALVDVVLAHDFEAGRLGGAAAGNAYDRIPAALVGGSDVFEQSCH